MKILNNNYASRECNIFFIDTTQSNATGLCVRKDNGLALPWPSTEEDHKQAQYRHLYVTSEDKIERGEWYFSQSLNSVEQYTQDELLTPEELKSFGDLKIIASTDPRLSLRKYSKFNSCCRSEEECYCKFPSPSNDFIKLFLDNYNSKNHIYKVFVDFEYSCCACFKYGMCCGDDVYEPVIVDKHIVIKIIDETFSDDKSVKKSWNREEHISEIKRIANILYFSPNREVDFNDEEELNNWIEKMIK